MDMDAKKDKAYKWFSDLRTSICTRFEELEQELDGGNLAHAPAGSFEMKPWDRAETNQPNQSGSVLNGGGEMAIMRGRVFEKVGVNISCVHGKFSPEFAEKIPGATESDGDFWAAGISLVAHMQSPLVPAVHMNTRMICTSKSWFGGGADLTPMYENKSDTSTFHKGFEECGNRHNPDYYKEHKEWCDRYFYLPHRDEPRGVGGIFFDYLDTGDWKKDFAYTQDVGKTFLKTYPEIVARRMNERWTDEQRHHQLVKRGRYVEFNLLYDRGTTFGLKTGGNTEAILMSMPPEVRWP